MKILVVSHNSFSTFQSMGKTFCTLFSKFEKNEVCQLYTYLNNPDCDVCSSFFRMSDKDVLNWYKRVHVTGRVVRSNEIQSSKHQLFDDEKDIKLYRKNKSPLKKIARDLMWFFAPWFTKALKDWLDKEKPTHIFLAPGDYCFIYNVALKCSKYLKIPIVTYVCDEYFFVNRRMSFIEKLHYQLLRGRIKRTCKISSRLITICDNLKNSYENYFKTPAYVLMTGSSFAFAKEPRVVENITEMTYMGNLSCNRYVSLLQLGKALDSINKSFGKDISLKIYTAENDEIILKRLKEIPTIRLMGFVSGDEFDKIFHSCDVLLHVEAFDENSIDLVKNSISTKIADSLGSGIPLLAYGPSHIASIEYLKKEECAFCIDNQECLTERLTQFLLLDKDDRLEMVYRALNVAKLNHDKKRNSQKMYESFEKVF